MKRLFYSVGVALMLGFFSSCAQHDTKSPDTSGGVPVNQPGAGVDTTNAGTNNNTGAGGNNMSNDGTNNNQTTNTGDTSKTKTQGNSQR